MLQFNLTLRKTLVNRNGWLIFAALFFVRGFSQNSNLDVSFTLPLKEKMIITFYNDCLYLTPKEYDVKSYIVKWDIKNDTKDTFNMSLPNLEGMFQYKITSFNSNSKFFVLCFVDYLYLLERSSQDKDLKVKYVKQFKDMAIEHSYILDSNKLQLVLTSTKKNINKRYVKIINFLDGSENDNVFTNESFFLAHLGPSSYFSRNSEALFWLDPLSYKIHTFDSNNKCSTFTISDYFNLVSDSIKNAIFRENKLEGKMSIVMSCMDTLQFDFLEEIYTISDITYVVYSKKGNCMSCANTWSRYVTYFKNEEFQGTLKLDNKKFNVLDLHFFEKNRELYVAYKEENNLRVSSLASCTLKQ